MKGIGFVRGEARAVVKEEWRRKREESRGNNFVKKGHSNQGLRHVGRAARKGRRRGNCGNE